MIFTVFLQAANPIADWHLDEKKYDGSTGEVKDSAQGYNGTSGNTITDQDAKVTHGVVCNGIDLREDSTKDYVKVPKDPFANLKDFTISVWLKSNSSHDASVYAGSDNSDNGYSEKAELWIEPDSQKTKIWMWLTSSSYTYVEYSGNLFDDQWHHVVWRRNDQTNCIFVDKNQIGSCGFLDNSALDIQSFVFGQEPDKNGEGYQSSQDYEGDLDEFLVFREALSDTEISNIYNNQKAGKNWDGSSRTCPKSADMIINEILYNQNNDTEEFVELLVKNSGTLEGYMIHDQENGNPFIFPDVQVNAGDYVIVRKADNDNYTHTGNVHYFDREKPGFALNDNGDDVNIYKPSDASDWTTIKSTKYPVIPVDYVAYGSGADSPQSSDNGISPSWSTSYQSELSGAADGQSISLTPNGTDSDKAGCWELTTSGNAANNGCANYLPTRDTEPNNANLTYSIGQDNNGLPDMHISKTSMVIDDPVNGSTNSKRIPGATIRYCFTVKNTGTGTAENPQIHDTFDNNGNKDKLTYSKSGKGSIINDTNDCSESDCKNLGDTSGSYDVNTKEVTVTLDNLPANSHECAYIDAEIK